VTGPDYVTVKCDRGYAVVGKGPHPERVSCIEDGVSGQPTLVTLALTVAGQYWQGGKPQMGTHRCLVYRGWGERLSLRKIRHTHTYIYIW
jgi:hypothetical protein